MPKKGVKKLVFFFEVLPCIIRQYFQNSEEISSDFFQFCILRNQRLKSIREILKSEEKNTAGKISVFLIDVPKNCKNSGKCLKKLKFIKNSDQFTKSVSKTVFNIKVLYFCMIKFDVPGLYTTNSNYLLHCN